MPSTDFRRDLTLAQLALKHGFVDELALQDALRAWLDWPDDALLDQLMRKGQLSSDQRRQLEVLFVEENVEVEDTSTAKWSPEQFVSPTSLISTKGDERDCGDTALDAEATIQHTSSLPAPIVSGKNDERFTIHSTYAQGALGEIFIAQDTQLGRMVALKQIKARYADDSAARARFLLEAQITGRLEHPGIVPVYALGFDPSGRPHYAMRFIEGESLLEVVSRFHNRFDDAKSRQGERLLELRKLLARFVVVCQTLDYAHSRGILHRDVKPANIMLGKYGETLLVDWGLAKIVGGGSQQQIVYQEIAGAEGLTPTAKGTAIGTPAYMSPEQALGNIDEMGPRTDVYSLGVTLYHILTGRLPREEGSVSGVLEQIKKEVFQPPSAHCGWLPKALEAICLKAMATRAEDRYASAALLAEDVEKWLAGERVTAHAPSLGERLCNWLRRRY